jgi:hypothetical protein
MVMSVFSLPCCLHPFVSQDPSSVRRLVSNNVRAGDELSSFFCHIFYEKRALPVYVKTKTFSHLASIGPKSQFEGDADIIRQIAARGCNDQSMQRHWISRGFTDCKLR